MSVAPHALDRLGQSPANGYFVLQQPLRYIDRKLRPNTCFLVASVVCVIVEDQRRQGDKRIGIDELQVDPGEVHPILRRCKLRKAEVAGNALIRPWIEDQLLDHGATISPLPRSLDSAGRGRRDGVLQIEHANVIDALLIERRRSRHAVVGGRTDRPAGVCTLTELTKSTSTDHVRLGRRRDDIEAWTGDVVESGIFEGARRRFVYRREFRYNALEALRVGVELVIDVSIV